MKGHTTPHVRHLPLSVAPLHEPQSSEDPSMKRRSTPAQHHLPLSLTPLHEPVLGAWHSVDVPQHYLPYLEHWQADPLGDHPHSLNPREHPPSPALDD